jgi:hypothetical protein
MDGKWLKLSKSSLRPRRYQLEHLLQLYTGPLSRPASSPSIPTASAQKSTLQKPISHFSAIAHFG